jgi:hypothetical protein
MEINKCVYSIRRKTYDSDYIAVEKYRRIERII